MIEFLFGAVFVLLLMALVVSFRSERIQQRVHFAWLLLPLICTGKSRTIHVPTWLIDWLLERNRIVIPSFVTIPKVQLKSVKLVTDAYRICRWLWDRQSDLFVDLIVGELSTRVDCCFLYADGVTILSSVPIRLDGTHLKLTISEGKMVGSICVAAVDVSLVQFGAGRDNDYDVCPVIKISKLKMPNIDYLYTTEPGHTQQLKMRGCINTTSVSLSLSLTTILFFQKIVMNVKTWPIKARIPSRFLRIERSLNSSYNCVTVEMSSSLTDINCDIDLRKKIDIRKLNLEATNLNVQLADQKFGKIFELDMSPLTKLDLDSVIPPGFDFREQVIKFDIESIRLYCRLEIASQQPLLLESGSNSNPWLSFSMSEMIPLNTKEMENKNRVIPALELNVAADTCFNAEPPVLVTLYQDIFPGSVFKSYVSLGLFSSELRQSTECSPASDDLLFKYVSVNAFDVKINFFPYLNPRVHFSRLEFTDESMSSTQLLDRIVNHYEEQFNSARELMARLTFN